MMVLLSKGWFGERWLVVDRNDGFSWGRRDKRSYLWGWGCGNYLFLEVVIRILRVIIELIMKVI